MEAETKNCEKCQSQFIIAPEDFDFYKKIDVLPPKLCPDCRYQRRIGNRNEWNLYRRVCDLCKKDMISIYNSDYKGPVYCQPCFWSDNWDARDYGQDFDFSKTFFEQHKELRFKVPRIAITNAKSVNSEYSNQSQGNKNCYLIVASNLSEDCMYGNWFQEAKFCMDGYIIQKSELVYESVNCFKCYNSAYLQNCNDCHSSYFLKNCSGCQDCFGCVGLRNKKYHWFNEKLDKETYQARLKEFTWSRKEIHETKKKFKELIDKFPQKFYEGKNNLNSTGDYLDNNKNNIQSFHCKRNEDVKYSQDAYEVRNSYDLTEVLDNEYDYQVEGTAWSARNIVASKAWDNHDISYCELCFNSHDLFGCVSMNKKEFCILNKSYSKEEYKEMRERIIAHMKETGEWGQYWPIDQSPFSYNESVAQEYFPLTKDEVLKQGWRWYDRENRSYAVTVKPNELPETIKEVEDSILNEVIGCDIQESDYKKNYISCATAFKVTKPELDFYRKMNLPIPKRCFPCRRQDRFSLRNPRKLNHRQCMCDYKVYNNESKHSHHPEGRCSNEFKTSYSAEREEIIYCEPCYQAEVV